MAGTGTMDPPLAQRWTATRSFGKCRMISKRARTLQVWLEEGPLDIMIPSGYFQRPHRDRPVRRLNKYLN